MGKVVLGGFCWQKYCVGMTVVVDYIGGDML